eukprot:GEMP01043455.1.p1 GENE.GEMP01043455.1~~GEMP01043455.1.p1  ORF type:complete len:153 (+),score=30.07 GEMP01043455.1:721-1179(+)
MEQVVMSTKECLHKIVEVMTTRCKSFRRCSYLFLISSEDSDVRKFPRKQLCALPIVYNVRNRPADFEAHKLNSVENCGGTHLHHQCLLIACLDTDVRGYCRLAGIGNFYDISGTSLCCCRASTDVTPRDRQATSGGLRSRACACAAPSWSSD